MEGCQHNTMDVEYYGPNPQMGGWYLGALRAAEEMARYLGDDAIRRQDAATCSSRAAPGSTTTCSTASTTSSEIRPPRQECRDRRGSGRRHAGAQETRHRLSARRGLPGGPIGRPVHGPCLRAGLPAQQPAKSARRCRASQATTSSDDIAGPFQPHAHLCPQRRSGHC